MPLARIEVPAGKSADDRSVIGEVVYNAMTQTLNVPKDDRFQVITEHPRGGLIIDPTYMGIERTQHAIIIQVTLSEGRSVDLKRAFYKAIVDGLHERLGHRRQDVMINLVEVKKENWSFGNGEAQYAT
jgi:4-oxalocrotonate tautomerase